MPPMNKNLMLTQQVRIKRREDMIYKVLEGQVVLLDIEKSMIYELNELGSFIWISSSRYIPYQDLIKKIEKEYVVKRETLIKDLELFFEKNSFLFKFK